MEIDELVGLILDLEAVHGKEDAKTQYLNIMGQEWDEAKKSYLYKEEIIHRRVVYNKFFKDPGIGY